MAEPQAPGQPRWRSILGLVLLIGSLAYVGNVLWKERAELSRALELSPLALTGLVVFMLLGHIQRTYEFTYMLRRLGVHEPFVEGFLLTGAGYLLNHLPFNAGLVMRATVLKRDHALPYASYLSLVMVNAIINVATAALLGIATLAFTRSLETPGTVPMLAAFVAVLLACAVATWLPLSWVPPGAGFIGRRLRLFAEGIALIRGNGFAVALLTALSLSKVVVTAVRMWICFRALGADVSPLSAGLLASTTILFSLVNVTPGNLGLREVALAAIATLLGETYGVGMAAASIDRVVLLAYTVLSGLPGLYALRRRGPFGTRPAR